MVWLWVLVNGFVVLVGGMVAGVVEVVVWRRKTAQSTA